MSAILNTYNRKKISFKKGKGSFLYGSNGKKYLDFVQGIAVNCLGHSNNYLNRAINGISFNSKKTNGVLIYLIDLYAQIGEKDLALGLIDRVILSGSMELSRIESQNVERTNFSLIDQLNVFWGNMKTLKKICDSHEFLKTHQSLKKVDVYQDRVKAHLDKAVIAHPYFKMLIGARPTLLNLMKK